MLAPWRGLGVLCGERGQGRGRRVAGGREGALGGSKGQRACAELRAVGRVNLNAAPSLSWRQMGSSLGARQGTGGSGGAGERREPLSSSPRCRSVHENRLFGVSGPLGKLLKEVGPGRRVRRE